MNAITLSMYRLSLIPRPPLFLPSVCIHNNTRERKASENSEGLRAFIT